MPPYKNNKNTYITITTVPKWTGEDWLKNIFDELDIILEDFMTPDKPGKAPSIDNLNQNGI